MSNVFPCSDDEAIEFVKNNSVEFLAGWLKKGFLTLDFDHLSLNEHSSTAVQLKYFFSKLNNASLRDKFKAAVTQAVAGWNFEADSPIALEGLVVLAAYIRAFSIIEIIEHILEGLLIGDTVETKYEDLVEKILSVLAGFARSNLSESIQKLFESIFFSQFDARYAVQLFIGLCICYPKSYPRYLARLLDLSEKYPNLYDLRLVMKTFLNIVSSEIILEKFDNIQPTYKDKLKDIPHTDILSLISSKSTNRKRIMPFDIGQNWVEEVRSIRNQLISFKGSKRELIQASLKLVRDKLFPQVASIYLFSKEGYLYCAGIDGVDLKGNPIREWFDEKYSVDDSDNPGFIAKAAKPDQDERFGKSQFLNFFASEQLPAEAWEHYTNKLGMLNCGIAVPLDGRNKTFGVLAIINKVDEKTGIPLNSCAFSNDEYFWLSEICSLIATAISNYRKSQQDRFENDLAELLISSPQVEQPADVYKEVVRRLTSENTAFKACVIRIKNEAGELEVIEPFIAADTEEESQKLLEDRIDEVIKPGEGIPGWTAEKREPRIFQIDDSNIGEFLINEHWVRKNEFKSFGCFPLVANEKLVGTLSLYVAYKYDFHTSCREFLGRLTTLLASFIFRVTESRAIRSINEEIGNIRTILSDDETELKVPGRSEIRQTSISDFETSINNVEKYLVSITSIELEGYSKYD
jgi:hypothetical protein